VLWFRILGVEFGFWGLGFRGWGLGLQMQVSQFTVLGFEL